MTQNGTGGLVLEQILWHDLSDGKEKHEHWDLEHLESPYGRIIEKNSKILAVYNFMKL